MGAARTTNMNRGSDRIGAPPVSSNQLPHERENVRAEYVSTGYCLMKVDILNITFSFLVQIRT
jgi:hypothetical protein